MHLEIHKNVVQLAMKIYIETDFMAGSAFAITRYIYRPKKNRPKFKISKQISVCTRRETKFTHIADFLFLLMSVVICVLNIHCSIYTKTYFILNCSYQNLPCSKQSKVLLIMNSLLQRKIQARKQFIQTFVSIVFFQGLKPWCTIFQGTNSHSQILLHSPEKARLSLF